MTAFPAALLVRRTGPLPVHRVASAAWHPLPGASVRRGMSPALLALADRLVAILSTSFLSALGVTTTATNVVISATQQHHILTRRRVSSQVDADVAVNRIGEAVEAANFLLIPHDREDVFELIGHVATADRHLLVALKLVSGACSKSGRDEWWVRTAYPIGAKKLRQLSSKGRLRTLAERLTWQST